MKKQLIAVAAVAVMAFGIPASAHEGSHALPAPNCVTTWDSANDEWDLLNNPADDGPCSLHTLIDRGSPGAGEDIIFSAGGNDDIAGGDGPDWLFGESNNDELRGQVGADHLAGGVGHDTIVDEGDTGDNDRICDGDGDDFINVDDNDGNDVITMASDGVPGETVIKDPGDTQNSGACPF